MTTDGSAVLPLGTDLGRGLLAVRLPHPGTLGRPADLYCLERPRLRAPIDETAPDVIVSTWPPITTEARAGMRANGEFGVPVAASNHRHRRPARLGGAGGLNCTWSAIRHRPRGAPHRGSRHADRVRAWRGGRPAGQGFTTEIADVTASANVLVHSAGGNICGCTPISRLLRTGRIRLHDRAFRAAASPTS